MQRGEELFRRRRCSRATPTSWCFGAGRWKSGFEKQLFKNSRGCLCVEGREGLEKALHPFQMGLKQEVLDLQLLHFGSQV